MNPHPNDFDLLDDILSESIPGGFDEALLRTTLSLAARKRRRRSAARMLAVAAVAAVLFIGAGVVQTWVGVSSRETVPGCVVVRTVPLPRSALVRTVSAAPGMLVATASPIETVHTTSRSGRYRLLADAELLAFVIHHPAILVGESGGRERLVFTNPADAQGFRAN